MAAIIEARRAFLLSFLVSTFGALSEETRTVALLVVLVVACSVAILSIARYGMSERIAAITALVSLFTSFATALVHLVRRRKR